MKVILLYLMVLVLFFSSCSYKNETEEKMIAKDFNDKMIAIQKEVDNSFVNIIVAIDTFDKDKILEAKQKAKSIIKKSLQKIEDTEESIDFKDYKKEVKMLLEVYQSIISNEFKEIYYIYSMPDEEYEESHKQKVYELFDKALKQYSISLSEFSIFQERFAEVHGLELK